MGFTNLEEQKWAELESEYSLLFLTKISLYNAYIVLIGLMSSGFIVMIIVLAGLVEVYRPLRRLKVFAR